MQEEKAEKGDGAVSCRVDVFGNADAQEEEGEVLAFAT